MVLAARRAQRRREIHPIDVGTAVDEERRHFDLAVPARDLERGDVIMNAVDLDAAVEAQPRGADLTLPNSDRGGC